jgi:hypothetical protein
MPVQGGAFFAAPLPNVRTRGNGFVGQALFIPQRINVCFRKVSFEICGPVLCSNTTLRGGMTVRGGTATWATALKGPCRPQIPAMSMPALAHASNRWCPARTHDLRAHNVCTGDGDGVGVHCAHVHLAASTYILLHSHGFCCIHVF